MSYSKSEDQASQLTTITNLLNELEPDVFINESIEAADRIRLKINESINDLGILCFAANKGLLVCLNENDELDVSESAAPLTARMHPRFSIGQQDDYRVGFQRIMQQARCMERFWINEVECRRVGDSIVVGRTLSDSIYLARVYVDCVSLEERKVFGRVARDQPESSGRPFIQGEDRTFDAEYVILGCSREHVAEDRVVFFVEATNLDEAHEIVDRIFPGRDEREKQSEFVRWNFPILDAEASNRQDVNDEDETVS